MIRENEYSVSESSPQGLSRQSFKDHFLGNEEKQILDLNLLLKRNWKRFENNGSYQMAARFDPLPLVEGDETKWQFVFDGLLSMIMHHPPKGFFFLHIKCEPFIVNTVKTKLKKGFINFQIHFKTNILVDDKWYQLYNDKLKTIEMTVDALRGTLNYNGNNENGCLFSITLPGKQD